MDQTVDQLAADLLHVEALQVVEQVQVVVVADHVEALQAVEMMIDVNLSTNIKN